MLNKISQISATVADVYWLKGKYSIKYRIKFHLLGDTYVNKINRSKFTNTIHFNRERARLLEIDNELLKGKESHEEMYF